MPRARRIHFHTVAHVLRELGRQYRRADAGELAWADLTPATRALVAMRQMIEGSVLEQRIEALEAAAAEHELGPRPNGHARHEVRQ